MCVSILGKYSMAFQITGYRTGQIQVWILRLYQANSMWDEKSSKPSLLYLWNWDYILKCPFPHPHVMSPNGSYTAEFASNIWPFKFEYNLTVHFVFIFKNFLTFKIPLNESILHLNLSGKNLADNVPYETFQEKLYHLKKQKKLKALRLWAWNI